MRFAPITRSRVPLRGLELHHLATRRDVDTVNPETISRYESLPRAVYSAGRMAVRSDMYGYVIHESRRPSPIGIATVKPNQLLRSRETGLRILVNDVDYCLVRDADNEMHRAAAAGTIKASARELLWSTAGEAFVEASRGGGMYVRHEYAATIDPQNTAANRGFSMLPLMNVDAEYVLNEPDYDGMSKGGTELTYLYRGDMIGGNNPLVSFS